MKNAYPLIGILLVTMTAIIEIRSHVHTLDLLQYFENCIFRHFILDPKEGHTSPLIHFLHFVHKLKGRGHILETVSNTTAQGRHNGNTIWATHSRFQNCMTFLVFQDALIEQAQIKEPLYRILRPAGRVQGPFKYIDPTFFIFVSNQWAPLVPNYEMAHLDVTSTFFFYSPQGLHLFCAISHKDPLWLLLRLDVQYVNTLWMQCYSQLGHLQVHDGTNRKWDHSEDCSHFHSS